MLVSPFDVGPCSIAKFVNRTPIPMVTMVFENYNLYVYSIHGVHKPIYNVLRPHIVVKGYGSTSEP